MQQPRAAQALCSRKKKPKSAPSEVFNIKLLIKPETVPWRIFLLIQNIKVFCLYYKQPIFVLPIEICPIMQQWRHGGQTRN